MKRKLFILILPVFMLLSLFALEHVNTDLKPPRFLQHLMAQSATVGNAPSEILTTHLPILVIDTGNQVMPGETTGEKDRFGESFYTVAADGRDVISGSLQIMDNSKQPNQSNDEPVMKSLIDIRIRGHASRSFPKKSYLIRLRDEQAENLNMPLLGMGAHHEWVLHGPFIDQTLLRNYMWYNISGNIMDYAPNVRFCEVILDGDYKGLYVLTESITNGEDRLGLTKTAKNAQAIGYLLKADRPYEADLGSVRDIYTYAERMGLLHQDISIVYPGTKNLTPELAKRIELNVSAFERALYSYDFNDPLYGYRQYIDTQSFVNYFIINEISGNADAALYSTYLYKLPGGLFKLCVWDFNNACDNFIGANIDPEGFNMTDRIWYFMLMKDEHFVHEILETYEKLRETLLSDTALETFIDETLAYLGPAIERNNTRWQQEILLWNEEHGKELLLTDTEQAVANMKNWLTARTLWLDKNIHILQQYCHPSRVKTYVH